MDEHPLRTTMTVERFLAWESLQELRYEFDGRAPRAVQGGTAAHSAVAIYADVELKTAEPSG